MTSESPAARRRLRTGRVIGWILIGILLVAIFCTAWIGVRGFLAYQHLDSARASAGDASGVLADPTKAAGLISDISKETSAAHRLTDDVVWKAAEGLPWVGPQLAAVSTVASALDDVASDALTPLASVAASFSVESLRPQDGAIDVAPFAEMSDAVVTGAAGLGAANASIASVDRAPLLAPVRDAVDEVSTIVGQAYAGADALSRATQLLPGMLGTDEPRDYLVVFQNNAEWRSLGGIVGALVLLHTENGRVTLTTQASSADFPRYDAPVVPLSDDEVRVFGEQPATFVQNITQLPDFPRDAEIAQKMWELNTGTTVDGVLSLDPVALSYLLAATGDITLPTGDVLTSDNAVQLLLNEVYLRYQEPADQDVFFASAAASVFDKIASGDIEPAAFVSALAQAGAENRLLLWNAAPEEQAVLDGTTLQGSLNESPDSSTTFGVYANDGTSSKMDYYMSLASNAGWCAAGEPGLTVALGNNAPADAASLPEYITGGGKHGTPAGEVETVIYVYLPAGATLTSTSTTGSAQDSTFGGGTIDGQEIVIWTTRLAPGQQITLDVRVQAPQIEPLVTRMTPTVNSENAPSACATL